MLMHFLEALKEQQIWGIYSDVFYYLIVLRKTQRSEKS